MATMLNEVRAEEFEQRLGECHQALQEIVAYLRTTAEHVGADVQARRHVPKTGWGVTYYRGAEWFCQFHPKSQSKHVQVLVQGADHRALNAAGFTPARRKDEQPWVQIGNMRDAVRLVPFILAAAGPDLKRHTATEPSQGLS